MCLAVQHFGHGHAALSEAGKKGAEISTKMRTEEQRKEAARKARPLLLVGGLFHAGHQQAVETCPACIAE